MFAFKQLTSPADLDRYKAAYQLASRGVAIADAYLPRAHRVIVAYDTVNPDIFWGGYIISPDPPMRYFVAPGDAARDAALAPLGLTEADLVEIGAIWLATYRSPWRELHRLLFFGAMLRDALRTRRPYILGGSFIRAVQDSQRVVLPHLIFEQVVTVGTFTGTLQLYVGPRRGTWRRFARCAARNVRKRLLNRLRTQWRGANPLRPILP
jgi:hypothetical protein